MSNWLLLGGCPRSGTTLLTQLLSSHPNLHITNEQNILKVYSKIKSIYAREKQVLEIIDREKGKKENWTKEDVLNNTLRESLTLVPALEAMYRANYGVSLDESANYYFGDKKPLYWQNASFPEFEKQFKPKVIHVSRHPYDVVNSYFRRKELTQQGKDYWKRGGSLEDVCHDWLDAWNFIVSKKNDPNYLHIKYEDLVFKASETLNSISSFLGIGEDGYKREIVVKEHHYERDYITESDLQKVDGYLLGLGLNWDTALDRLESLTPTIPQIISTNEEDQVSAKKITIAEKMHKEKGMVLKIKDKLSKKIKNLIKQSVKNEIASYLSNIPTQGRIERKNIMKVIFDFTAKSGINGHYLEFGCYQGNSFVSAYKELSKHVSMGRLENYKFFIFDSFEGLPELDTADQMPNYSAFNQGDYACSLDEFTIILKRNGVKLDNVELVKGYYEDSLKDPKKFDIHKASVAHIDCDLYSSTVPVLDFLLDKLQDGTVLLFDDYYCYKGNPKYGVRRALNEWKEKHGIQTTKYVSYGWAGQSFIVNL